MRVGVGARLEADAPEVRVAAVLTAEDVGLGVAGAELRALPEREDGVVSSEAHADVALDA